MKKLIRTLILLLLIFLGYKFYQTYSAVKQVMTYQTMYKKYWLKTTHQLMKN